MRKKNIPERKNEFKKFFFRKRKILGFGEEILIFWRGFPNFTEQDKMKGV